MILSSIQYAGHPETHRVCQTLHSFVEQLLPLAHGHPSFRALCTLLKFDKDTLPSIGVLFLE